MHTHRTVRLVGVALTTLIVAAVAPTHAQAPEAVSPGGEQVLSAPSPCPTFSWTAIPDVAGYELLVYDVTEYAAAGYQQADLVKQVLAVKLPAGATSWTPSAESCLPADRMYAWAVRATVGDGSELSELRWFEVRAVPDELEVGRAVEVLRRYLEATGTPGPTQPPAAVRNAERRQAPQPPVEISAKALADGPTAIRAARGETSGAAYGVVASVATADGAALAAQNTAGGADLLLDGAPGAAVTEKGWQLSDPAPQVFDFSNPQGELAVRVNGVDLLQSLSLDGNILSLSGDASTVDLSGYLDNTDDQSLAEVLAIGHDAAGSDISNVGTLGATSVATTGGNVATNHQLVSTAAAGTAPLAVSSTTMVANLNAQYLAGLDASAFSSRLAPAARNAVQTIDGLLGVGSYTSTTVGTDGLGLISYYDSPRGNLRVAHCANTACTSATITTIDSDGYVGAYTSITIGTDGLGLISYYDATNGDLKVAHCADAACTSAGTSTVDSTGNVGYHTSITVGADGLGLISYFGFTTGDLKVAHCADTACTSATTAVIDSTDLVGMYTSIATGTDGLGLISYYDYTNRDLKVAHCANTACTSATTTTIDSTGDVGSYTSITIGADGLGLISYYGFTTGDLKTAHCLNTACTSAATTTIDSTGDVGWYTSITLGTDGFGLISYHDYTNGDLKVAHCTDAACTSATSTTVDSTGNVGTYISITIGADGLGLISYCDQTNSDLKVAHCANAFCTPYFRRR